MKSLLLILLALLGSGSCFKPVRVGDLLPSGEAGSVAGLVFLLDHTTLYIRDFQYQVQGTDGNFCAGSSTSNVSDAFIITGSAVPSPFTNGNSSRDIELILPDGVTVAQLAWFGVCSDSDTTNVLASAVILPEVISNIPCNATFIGELPSGSNGIAGRVYLLDRITFVVIGFSYDGGEPDVFFWVGPGDTPSVIGYPCTYGDDVITSLPAFSDQDVVVHVPSEAEGTEINHFALYCRSNNVDLVRILVPDGVIPIAPTLPPVEDEVFIGSLLTRAHDVRGSVFALNQKQLMLTNFHFDGNAPGAQFYAVQGPSVRSPDFWIVPDETGSTSPLDSYSDRTIVLTLPDPITIHDIDWFSVWCVPFRQNFGEVRIPDDLVVSDTVVAAPTLPPIEECEELEPEVPVNCQQLTEDITVSWSIDSTNDIVVFQLCGCVLPDNYIAFGISGSESGVQMVGADVTWTWLDNEGVHAGDMDLTQRAQCLMETQPGGEITQSGACPDVQDDVTSVSGFREGCTTCIKFARPLNSSDPRDKPFSTDGDQFMIWSTGPVGTLETPLGDTIPVPFRHFERANPTDDLRVNLGRSPVDQCNLMCSDCEVVLEPWPQPVLEHTTTIRAQIGQSGSERGYTGITGTAGWGIAWYLNGMLIPRVTVYRGTTYTFITEGGEDPTNSARYHPFYITDNDRGGYLAKSPNEQQAETLFAGFDGETPLGVGRYCEYENIDTDRSREFDTFDAYLSTLVLECDDGEPGMFTWTPDENTPDTVYYQCATHQFLGWQIDVLDAIAMPDITSSGIPASVMPTPVDTDGPTATVVTPTVVMPTPIGDAAAAVHTSFTFLTAAIACFLIAAVV